jgi:hypothetical protein
MRYPQAATETATQPRSSQTMKKTTILLTSLLCLTTMACKPHPAEHAARGIERQQRMEQRDGAHRGGGLRRVCRSDIEQFCASDQTGRDRRQCLQSHMDKLSADCKTAVQDRMNRRGGRRNRDQNGQTGQTGQSGQTNQNDDN